MSLPHSKEAEIAILAACMWSEEALNASIERLKPKHFYCPGHPQIWDKIYKMFSAGKIIAPDTIKAEFSSEAVKEYIGALANNYMPNTIEHVEESFIGTLISLHKIRELHWLLKQGLEEVDADELPEIDSLIEEIEAGLFALSDDGTSLNGATNDGIDIALKQIEAAMKAGGVIGITTGFRELDRILVGIAKKDLVIIAGRPSMGKTSLALAMADYVAQEETVLFFSLEMGKEQLEMKRLSMNTGINVTDMRSGNLTEEQVKELTAAKISRNLYIDDEGNLTVNAMLVRARRMKKKHGLGLVVIDYIGLMKASSHARKDNYTAVTEISKSLKAMAKELDCPVMALSQLNRGVEQRENKRPMLSDLRDSGAIEQDADCVIFCYRDEYYLEREGIQQYERETKEKYHERMLAYDEKVIASKGKAEIIVAKNRHGRIGTAELGFIGEQTLFHNL